MCHVGFKCRYHFRKKQFAAHNGHLLPVGDNDDQDGGDAADDDDNGQRQQRSLRVADSLHSFLHVGHHLGGSDLQNAPARREEGLELLVDVQEFAVQKPGDEKT